MKKNAKPISIPKMISVSILYILGSAGVIFFYNLFLDPSKDNFSKATWAILFGVTFAFLNNYKFIIQAPNKSDINK